MTSVFRRFSKRFLIFINFLVVAIFLLACLAAYINPGTFWIFGVLGVGFVFLLIAVVLFFIFWLLFRSKWAWLSLSALAIGWFQIHVLFGLNAFTQYKNEKREGAIRILQWNVTSWDELDKKAKNNITYRKDMFDYIEKQDADILCFQEFFESSVSKYFDPNVSYIVKKLNYPYYYFVGDNHWWDGKISFGVAIFSRYPITDTIRIRYPSNNKKHAGESLVRATVNVNGQKINVFTTHLQSFQFKGPDYDNIAILKSPEENKGRVLQAGKGILAKFRNAYKTRHVQADMVKKELDKSAHPSIITGDFNDVPNSYTYFTIKGNYQDAFVQKSFGLGRTFHFISPTLRIDYILADTNFEILQYKRDLLPYSDHYPLVADVRILEPKSQ